jgi:tetratricopeptide (TPR) repeat protein
MKRTTITLLLLVALTFSGYSQVDYIEYKERYNLSCGIPDSSVIVRNQQLVDSLENVEIIEGRQQYLYDHGWVYYIRYLKWKELGDLEKAATSFESGWAEYHDLTALWNLGLIYRVLGKCDKALDMTDLYVNTVPDSIPVDYQQVYYRYKHCRNKE